VFSGARKHSVTTVGTIFGIRCLVIAAGAVSTKTRPTIDTINSTSLDR
jgi:hypothetical protein